MTRISDPRGGPGVRGAGAGGGAPADSQPVRARQVARPRPGPRW